MSVTYTISAHFHEKDTSRFSILEWPGHSVLRIGNVDLYFHGAQANLLEEALPEIWAGRTIYQPEPEEALA